MTDTKMWNAYFKMKKMQLSELQNLRKIAISKNKLKFLKVIDYAIEMRNKEQRERLII